MSVRTLRDVCGRAPFRAARFADLALASPAAERSAVIELPLPTHASPRPCPRPWWTSWGPCCLSSQLQVPRPSAATGRAVVPRRRRQCTRRRDMKDAVTGSSVGGSRDRSARRPMPSARTASSASRTAAVALTSLKQRAEAAGQSSRSGFVRRRKSMRRALAASSELSPDR